MESISNAVGSLTNSLGIALCLKENVQSLQDKLQALEAAKPDLFSWIESAERQGQQAAQLVEWWLNEVDALHQECTQITTSLQWRHTFPLNVWSRYWISRRALDKLEAAAELRRTLQALMMAETADQDVPGVSSLAMVDMDHTFHKLKDYCIRGDEAAGIIGVHGMGGVGKTMMLRKLKNKLRGEFGAVAMVELSETFKEEQIRRRIATQLGLELENPHGRRIPIRTRIHDHLNARRFLVILDDVWHDVDLYSLGIPDPSAAAVPGSKVVVATRIAKVCASMNAAATVEMGCLSRQGAWELFLHMAGRESLWVDPEITRHAETLARRCGGLPLALQNVGLAMAGCRTVGEWERAAISVDLDPSGIPGVEEKVFRCLRRSYEHLGDDELRRCFLHCSLFPEGHDVDKQVLGEILLTHGIVEIQDGGRNEAYFRGLAAIGRLKSAGMLEIEIGFYGQERVRMHVMMRRLALWIASRTGRVMLSRAEAATAAAWENARVVSLPGSGAGELQASPVCRKLDTLLLAGKAMASVPSAEFFMHMPSLRVLDLSDNPLEELPSGIGVCGNLQYLVLQRTKLRSLPPGLGKLRKLEFLDISHNPRLQAIPAGLIVGLSTLQVLSASPSSYDSWEVGLPLKELEGLAGLRSLGVTVKTADALARLSSTAHLARAVDDLHLIRLEGTESIGLPGPALGRHMKMIRRLRIYSCPETRELVIGSNDAESSLSSGSTLQHLELWCLERMRRIVYAEPRASQFLHRLRELRIYRCGIEQVVDPETDLVLPNLKYLHLGDLQELGSVCRSMGSLPRLKFLGVYGCPNLKKLPSGMAGCRSLKNICGSREWWAELRWEDDGERSSLEALFNRRRQDHDDEFMI